MTRHEPTEEEIREMMATAIMEKARLGGSEVDKKAAMFQAEHGYGPPEHEHNFIDDRDTPPGDAQPRRRQVSSKAIRHNRKEMFRLAHLNTHVHLDGCTGADWVVLYEFGTEVCKACGVVKPGGIIHGVPEAYLMQGSTYKRVHHFNERITQFLCMDRKVPDEVVEQVKEWFAQNPTAAITKARIREALRSKGNGRYAEKWISIYCKLTGTPRPTLTPSQVETMRHMFYGIEVAFLRHRPQSRKSMLNYNFIFVRQLQMLGKHDYLKFFPMLKSKTKVRFLDGVWRGIAKDLNWEYKPLPTAKLFR